MFRIRCEVCGSPASATELGVVCVHSGRDGLRCPGTGLVVEASGEPLTSNASLGCRDGTYWDATLIKAPGADSSNAAKDTPQHEKRLAEAHAVLRYEWTVRARPPVPEWEQSGSSVRTVGGGLPGLGRRR